MDEMDMLRALGQVPEPSDIAVRRSRRRLVEHLAHDDSAPASVPVAAARPSSPTAVPARRWRPRGRVIGIAAAAVIAVTVLSVVRTGDDPLAVQPASAAELALSSAAEELQGRVTDERFLHVRVVDTRWAAVMLRRDRQEVAVGSDGRPIAWRNQTLAETWIPAGGEGHYVRRFGSRDYAPVSVDARRYFENGPVSWSSGSVEIPSAIADLPTGAGDVARWLRAKAPGELRGDAGAWEFGVSLLIDPALPPAVRPDVLAALGRLDSAYLTRLGARLDGRRVHVVGLRGSDEKLLIAPRSSRWLGVLRYWRTPGLGASGRSVTRFSLSRTAMVPSPPEV